MGLITRALSPRAHTPDPRDEFWWSSGAAAFMAASGIPVTPENAMKASAVWACVNLISKTLAMLPLIVYQRRTDGGRDRAEGHPLYDVLRWQPNRWQTAMEWKEMLQGHLLLRGNAYSQIVPGRRGFVDQLIPLHPDRVEPEFTEEGTVRYRVTDPDGTQRVLLQDEVFHLRAFSSDGLKGMSVIAYARESIGVALAAESYGARVFSQDARPGGVLEHPGTLSKEARDNLRRSWHEQHAGLQNAHKVAILEEGMKWHQIGLTNEDAQFLQTREFQIADIARYFGVPLHLIQMTEKSTSWGTGIEQLSLGFVIYTEMPWMVRWEQAVHRDLILAKDRYFAEFLPDALLRGDIKTRYEAYAIGRQWGWLSVNDVRRFENMNPVANGDEYLRPLNMAPLGMTPEEEERAQAVVAAALGDVAARRNGHHATADA